MTAGGDADAVRKECVAYLRASGKLQAGREVDFAWVSAAAATLALRLMGVAGFALAAEANPRALARVRDAARRQLEADRELAARRDDDRPF